MRHHEYIKALTEYELIRLGYYGIIQVPVKIYKYKNTYAADIAIPFPDKVRVLTIKLDWSRELMPEEYMMIIEIF